MCENKNVIRLAPGSKAIATEKAIIRYQPDAGFLERMEMNMALRARELGVPKRRLRARVRALRAAFSNT